MMLDTQALTGRTRDHVADFTLPDGRCFTAQPDAARAFLALHAAAAEAGIDLAVSSAFRDYAAQQAIWNAKWRGERPLFDANGKVIDGSALDDADRVAAILEWSALPGASRHHWGSDFDVFDRAAVPPGYAVQLMPEEYAADGIFARLAAWLDTNLARHGFFRPYDIERGGVHPEPWHISFAPIALQALRALQPAVLREALSADTLCGHAAVAARIEHIHACHVSLVAEPAPALLALATDLTSQHEKTG